MTSIHYSYINLYRTSNPLLLVLLLFLFAIPGFSQLEHGGSPLSFQHPSEGITIPVTHITPPSRDRLFEENQVHPIPYRFAVNLPVSETEGVWVSYPDGSNGWLAALKAPGAEAITLYFSRFYLPPGGALFVYNEERSVVLGAFTEENHRPDGTFATSLVPGDHIVIEYNQRSSGQPDPEIVISEIAYAYRGIPDGLTNQPSDLEGSSDLKGIRGFGSSGPCEVNVNCSEGANWQTEKKGVMRIGVKKGFGTYWCSGSLINNTRQDHTPYLLTADHCGQGATPQDISQWIFYFDFESAGCPNPPTSPSWWSLIGATTKAAAGDVNAGGSDFFLLLLDQEIPDTVEVWFNGWDRTGHASPDGVGIHHPQGDIKKISTYKDTLISTYWGDASEMTHWELTWSQTVNGHGVTEGGSSGSPLFDPQGRIVGILTGGEASCDSADLNLPDYYGKFSWAWDQNGSEPEKQLKPWLDPDNTGVEVLNGLPLGIDPPSLDQQEAIIFPNPCGNQITVRLPVAIPEESVNISFYDSRGIMVWHDHRKTLKTNNIPLNIGSIPAGFYMVLIASDSFSYTGRLVKLTNY